MTTPQPSIAVGSSSGSTLGGFGVTARHACCTDGRAAGSPRSASRARGRGRASRRACPSSCVAGRPARRGRTRGRPPSAGAFASRRAPRRAVRRGCEVGGGGDRDSASAQIVAARTSGSAWNGFAEERMKTSSPGSPATVDDLPSGTATACTRCVASTTPSRRTSTTIGSLTAEPTSLANGRDFPYGPRSSTVTWTTTSDDALVVEDPKQLRALGDVLRARIVMLLRDRAGRARPLEGPRDVPKGTVGHHLKVLELAQGSSRRADSQGAGDDGKFYGRAHASSS